jgi:hypothetical protein
MANIFKIVDWVGMESLRQLLNRLEILKYFNTDENKEFKRPFAVGEIVQKKLPQRYLIRNGMGYDPQPINRISVPITCNQIFGVDFEWDSMEKALNMERGEEIVKKEYIAPAMSQLAQEWDLRAAKFAAQNANNMLGVLGVDPTSLTTISQVRQRLNELACPPDGERILAIPSSVNTALVPAFASFLNPAPAITKQWNKGAIGHAIDFDWYESQSLYRHTAGTWAGAVTVNLSGQSGSSLAINCTAGDTFNVGDKFSIAAVNSVNPSTRQTVGSLTKQFTILAPLVGTGGGSALDVLTISPPINGPGSQYQNVDALPVNLGALTLFPGTPAPNGKTGTMACAIHPDAFAVVSVPLEEPKAVELAFTRRDPDTGMSISFVRQFDGAQRKMINRFDCLGGFGALYPDNCAAVMLCS